MFWLSGVLISLAWGVGAFGSPYPWAYIPLLASSATLGVTGLWLGRRGSGPSAVLVASLTLVFLAVIAQLVPLNASRLATLSPHAAAILRDQSVQFTLAGPASHPLSIDPVRTQLGLACFGGFALLLLGGARVLTRESATRLAGALVVLGVALAIAGIVQRATFNGRIYGVWELVQGGAPFGPFVNKNHFAGWMLMGLPVALGYLLALVARGMKGRQPGIRNLVVWFSSELASRAVLTGFALVVMALSLVLTMSRSGITACAVALLAVGVVAVRHESGASRRLFAAGYLAFLAITVVAWVGLDQIAARFADVDVANINQRPAMWADTMRIAKDFWLTGTGLNTYGISTIFYQTSVPDAHLREAHNDYLQLAAEGGLLLGLPVILVIVAFSREVHRRLREDVGSIWWIRIGAVTGLLAIALQSTVEFSLQMPGNAAMFAVVAALAIHDGRRQHTAHDLP